MTRQEMAGHVPFSHTCKEAEPLIWATPVSHAVCSSRKRRNRETQQRHAKSLKLGDRAAKRKLMAEPENSHAFAGQLLRNREPRTDEHFVDAIHTGHKACSFAGTLKRVFLQPVRCGQLWGLAEAVEVSV